MQCQFSVADSIRALLVSIGFRHAESKDFAKGLVRCTTPNDCISNFLESLLEGELRSHVHNAIVKLLKQKANCVWTLIFEIREKVEFNIAVASTRLQSAYRDIAEEKITCTMTPHLPLVKTGALVVAS